MYKLKSEIIEQIQNYHKKVYELYLGLWHKIKDPNGKILLKELWRQEKWRYEYLEKQKNIAKAMDCWLTYPTNTISNQLSDCLKNVNTRPDLSLDDLAEIEFHFDDCLIKFFKVLSNEEKNNGNITNIFHYMINKIKQEDIELQQTVTNLIL